MDPYQYEAVRCDVEKEVENKTWKPFLRQLFVCSCIWAHFFTLGIWHGTPTVVIPQLRREANSTDAVSDEMESWLSSVIGYASLPWAIILPLCMRRCGRKIPFIFASTCGLTSFIVYYTSSTAVQILVAEIIQGVIFSSNMTVSITIITEYTSPCNRGMFLTLKSATMNIAICIANAMGTFFHWKTIPVLGMVCALYSFGAVFWPESPYWLASKGRFDECATSHRWLKGTNDQAEKELKSLIESQKEYQKNYIRKKVQPRIAFKRFITNIMTKKFYKPTLLSLLLMALYYFSGKFVCVMYATQMIKKISGSESTAYTGMLILDVITVFSMYCGCVLIKLVKRRTLLLSSSFLAIILMFIISIYLYLVKLLVIKELSIVSLFLLVIYSISLGCGPLIMATSIYAELIPLRYKTFTLIVTVLGCGLIHATILKLSPLIFRVCGIHGTFLFFGISFSICIYLFYAFLPETKDKTLQEIENCFKDNLHENHKELKHLNKNSDKN